MAPSSSPPDVAVDQQDSEDFTQEFLRTVLRHQRIDLRQVSVATRWLVRGSIANVMLVVMVLVVYFIFHIGNVLLDPILIYALVMFPIAITLFTAGAIHASRSVRILIPLALAGVGFIMFWQIQHNVRMTPYHLEVFIWYCASNLILLAWNIIVWRSGHAAPLSSGTAYRRRVRFLLATLIICGVCIFSYYVNCAVLYLISGSRDSGVNNFRFLIEAVGGLAIPIYIISGSDYAEWGEILGGQLVRWARPRRTHILLACMILSVGVFLFCFDVIVAFGFNHLEPLNLIVIGIAVSLASALLLRFFVWLGTIDAWPSTRVPFGILVTAVIIGSALRFFYDHVPMWLSLILFVIIFVVCLSLVIRGRERQRYLSTAGLFILLVVLVGESGSVTLQNVQLGLLQLNHIVGVEIVFIPAILYTLFGLLITNRLRPSHNGLLAALLSLSVGITILTVLYAGINLAIHLSTSTYYLAAFLFLFAQGYELLTAGERYLNYDTPTFPRPARIWMFVGYITFVSTLVAFISITNNESTLHLTTSRFVVQLLSVNVTIPHIDIDVDHVSWIIQGIIILGLPIVIMNFILDVGHWIGNRKRHGVMAPVEIRHDSTAIAHEDAGIFPTAPRPIQVVRQLISLRPVRPLAPAPETSPQQGSASSVPPSPGGIDLKPPHPVPPSPAPSQNRALRPPRPMTSSILPEGPQRADPHPADTFYPPHPEKPSDQRTETDT